MPDSIKVNIFDKELYEKNLQENSFDVDGDIHGDEAEGLSEEDIKQLKEDGIYE